MAFYEMTYILIYKCYLCKYVMVYRQRQNAVIASAHPSQMTVEKENSEMTDGILKLNCVFLTAKPFANKSLAPFSCANCSANFSCGSLDRRFDGRFDGNDWYWNGRCNWL